MNSRYFRVIFSKTQQCLIVVSELAKATGKSSAETDGAPFTLQTKETACFALKSAVIKPLVFSLYCAFGFVSFSADALADALIIKADASAPENQRPIVLQTANGLPQVNIQTPNDKGLSHNKYQKFDVDTKGAILNNSHTAVKTQLAGMVQGNPHLARGEAKVILNEVNSSDPSVLKGYVEVAGKKADVIIANPSGLHCEGCGIINSHRATLTTGKPKIVDGRLESYVVEKGRVSVGGKGLDNSKVDYTEIIAKEAQINAGIWSDKQLNVITGQNTAKRTASAKEVQIVHRKPDDTQKQNENGPHFAVDVSELGGMYAQKIYMVGTEKGLGVRNAGHIGASSDSVAIDSRGRIINNGVIGALQQVQLNAENNIINKGRVQSRQGAVSLKSNESIQQDGSVTAHKSHVNVRAAQAITQKGETLANGNVSYTARNISTTNTSTIAAGIRFTQQGQHENRTLESFADNGKNILLSAGENVTAQGNMLASNHVQVKGKSADLSASRLSANSAELHVYQDNLVLNNSRIRTAGDLRLNTPAQLSTQSAQISADHLLLNANHLNNTQGLLESRGSKAVNLAFAGGFINRQGQVAAQGDLNLSEPYIDNRAGTVLSGGDLTVKANTLDNGQGILRNNGRQVIQVTDLDNSQGMLYSGGRQEINSAKLINRKGTIQSAGEQAINAKALNNQQGNITAKETLAVKTEGALNNVQGMIGAGGSAAINAMALDNDRGTVFSRQGELSVNTGNLNNQQGKILSQNHLTLLTGILDNSLNGVISTLSSLRIETQGQQLNNRAGRIVTQGTAVLNTGELDNQQGLITARQALSIDTHGHALDNSRTGGAGIISSGDMRLNNISSWNNRAGNVAANGQLNATAKQLDNGEKGVIFSAADLTLNARNLNNVNGKLQAVRNAQVTAEQLINNSGQAESGSLIQAGNNLTVSAKTIDNAQTKAATSSPAQGLIAANLTLNADQLNNQAGGIYAGGSFTGKVNAAVNNRDGEILSLNGLSLAGNNLALDNAAGTVESKGHLSLDLDHFVSEGTVRTQQNADIRLKKDLRLNNAFQVDGILSLTTQGNFYNNTRLLSGKGLHIQAKLVENPHNAALSSNHTSVSADTVNNRGIIDGTLNVIKAAALNNAGSGRIYGDHLAIQATQLNNLPQTVNGTTQAATIAARKRLDLAVGTLTNRDHALIFSLADMAIGGQLNADYYATGKAGFIDNGSATIEALGNGSINTARLWNHDLHVALGTTEQKEYVHELATEKDSKRYRNRVEGNFDWHGRNAWFDFYDPDKPTIVQKEWYGWKYDRITKTSYIKQQDPGKILIGGNLSLSGDNLHNQYSRLLIGGTLQLGTKVFGANANNGLLSDGKTTLNNEDLKQTIDVTDIGHSYFLKHQQKHGHDGHYEVHQSYFTLNHPTQEKDFNLVQNTIGDQGAVNGASAAHQIGTRSQAQQTALTARTIDTPAGEIKTVDAAALPGQNISQPTVTIKTVAPDTQLPQASLFRINSNPTGRYLVETDPRFTDRAKWLSSDYMIKALKSDQQITLKRLGDGFYEQRLVNEQINQLTGRRFLGGYTSDYEQYKALMDSGVRYAEQFGLIPGVELTAQQMKTLTEDMVWLVRREVSLPDGSSGSVLVPQVYVVARNTDIDSRGAVISAQRIVAQTTGDILNSGVISGRNLTALSGENLQNNGGTIAGEQLLLQAQKELANLGGTFSAENQLTAQGKSVRIESSVSETADTGDFYRKGINRQATVSVANGKAGQLILRGEEDVSLRGAVINSAGETAIHAGGQLNLGTLETVNKEHYNADGDNYYHLDQRREIGNRLTLTGNALLSGERGVHMRGAQLESNGTVNIASAGDISIEAGRERERLSTARKWKSKGLVSSTRSISRYTHDNDTAKGSRLDAAGIAVASRGGSVSITGSQLAAEQGLAIAAKENVSIGADKNRYYAYEFSESKKSGLMGSGGIGFTIGSKSQRHEYDENAVTQSDARSVAGSVQGNVSISAGNGVNILGTDLIARSSGSIAIAGQSVKVEAGKDETESTQRHEYRKSGLTVALSTPVTDMALNARESYRRSKEVKSERLSRLYQLKAAQEMVLAAQSAGKVGESLSALGSGQMNQGDSSSPSVKISIGVGASQSTQSSHSRQINYSGSELSAGSVSLKSTAQDIAILGSTVSADKVLLDSARNLSLSSVQDSYENRSDNKNSGWNLGVFLGMNGNSFGFGIEGSAQVGKGRENTDTVTQRNSKVNARHTVIRSGKDTALQGAVVNTERLEADIGGNLQIASRQDSNRYNSKQTQAGGSFAVAIYGSGSNAGINASMSKAKVNYAQVEEQSGFKVGDQGMRVEVAGNTRLTGGLIDSKAPAEKNRFSTGSLTAEGIENHSEVSVQSVSAGVSTNMGANALNAMRTAMSAMGNVNKEEHSTTHSVIAQNINLDIKTGEKPTALLRNSTNANNKVSRPDITEYKERAEAAQVIGEIGQNSITIALQSRLDEAQKAKEEATAALKDPTATAQTKQQAQQKLSLAQETLNRYGKGSNIQMAIRAVTGALQGIAAGSPNAAIVGVLSPYANLAIKQATTDSRTGEVNHTANLIAHAVLGAIEAQKTGNHAIAGAAGAVTAEATATLLSQSLYGVGKADADGRVKTLNDLTEYEKDNLSVLSQMTAGIAGGIIGDSTGSAIASSETGKRAVENNYLYNGEVDRLAKELAQAEKEGRPTEEIFDKYARLSEKNRQEIAEECGTNPLCYLPHIQMMKTGDEAAYEHSSKLRLTSHFNGLSNETQVALSDFVERENAKTRSQLPESLNYAGLALGAAEAIGLGGVALKDKLPKLSFSSKDKSYSNLKFGNNLSNANTSEDPLIFTSKINGTVVIPKAKYPETASHINDAIKQGMPDILTIDRKGAAQRRKEALSNVAVKKGFDRDEYPPAMFKEGGKNSSVRYVSPKDNRGAGSCIGHQCKNFNDGDKVKIKVEE